MRVALVLVGLLAVAGAVLLAHPAPPPAEERAILKGRAVLAAGFEGGDFSLVDLSGRRVSAADFGDRFLLLTFGVPASELSTLTLELMTRTLVCLGRDAGRFQPVFVSLTPTPGDGLGRYLAAFDRRLAGLSGSAAEIREVARRYRVRHDGGSTPGAHDSDHSAFLYLIAPGARAHSYYPPSLRASELCAELRGLAGARPSLTSVKDRPVARENDRRVRSAQREENP